MALSEKSCTLLVLLFSWVVYILLGVFVFKAVEDDGSVQNKREEDLLFSIKQNTTKAYNMTEDEFDNIAQQILSSSTTSTPQWSYAESLSFVVQLLTTIGYGNLTPRTPGGRVLCIFYAFFGIPLTILFLQLVGEKLLHGEQFLVTAFERRFLKRQGTVRYLNEKCFFLGFLILVILLITSAAIHMKIDGWTFLEGFYCFFITFTTVGFGDFIPAANGTESHLPSRIIFIILGLVAMSNVLNALVGCSDTAKLLGRIKACCESRQKLKIAKAEDDAVGTELDDEIKPE